MPIPKMLSVLVVLAGCGGGTAMRGTEAEVPRRAETPPADALSVGDALEVEDGRHIRMIAWLWRHAPECAPCPDDPDVSCEPCPPSYARFGDGPTPGDPGATGEIWVTPSEGIAEMEVGQRAVLEGEWMRVYEPGIDRAFSAIGRVTLLPRGEESAPGVEPEPETTSPPVASVPVRPDGWSRAWPFEQPCTQGPMIETVCDGQSVVGFYGNAYMFGHKPDSAEELFEKYSTAGRRPGVAAYWHEGTLWLTLRTCSVCAAIMGWSFVGVPSSMSDAQLADLQRRLGIAESPPLRTAGAWADAMLRRPIAT